MFDVPDSPYLVGYDDSFRVVDSPTRPPEDVPDEDDLEDSLDDVVDQLYELQRVLYADGRFAVLLVFQALDAGGKDSTIRHVFAGVNPAGVRVHSFKKPSERELAHDFLWRTACRLPERGMIGIFNRSYYEEVLAVRVHPEFLDAQHLDADDLDELWRQRYESIRDHEKHLARNGTMVLKFWLNVSPEEQRHRLLRRLERPDKHWKFSLGDLDERALWPDYMRAYEDAVRATSRQWAPWYAIPADDKDYMRLTVARIVRDALESLDLDYPEVDDAQRRDLAEGRRRLGADDA